MADAKIGDMTAIGALADGDEIAIADASAPTADVAATLVQFRDYMGSGMRKVSTAAQSPAAGSSVYLVGSDIAVPPALLRIGTVFRWTLCFSKTGAGVAARAHVIRIGTLGTTGDAAIVTLTSGTPSGVADQGVQVITAIVRGPLSASCILQASSWAIHQLSTTGLFPNETEVLLATSTTWNATTASLIVGLSVTSGTSEALTYEQVITEVYNL